MRFSSTLLALSALALASALPTAEPVPADAAKRVEVSAFWRRVDPSAFWKRTEANAFWRRTEANAFWRRGEVNAFWRKDAEQ